MMNKTDFDNKLSLCVTEKDLVVLADEVFEAINDGTLPLRPMLIDGASVVYWL